MTSVCDQLVQNCALDDGSGHDSIERLASNASHDLCRLLAPYFLPSTLLRVPVVASWGNYGACAIEAEAVRSNVGTDDKNLDHLRMRTGAESVFATSQAVGLIVHPFGSAVNGFGERDSDVDLAILVSDAGGNLITSHASYEHLCDSLRSRVAREKNASDDIPVSKNDFDAEQDRAAFVLGRVSEILQAGHAKNEEERHTNDPAFKRVASEDCLDSLTRTPCFEVVELVSDARIPVLKLLWGNIPVDVSFGNLEPLRNTLLLRSYADQDTRVQSLCSALKRWAREQKVCGAKQGHLSSYAFTLMGIYFLQVGFEASLNDRQGHGDSDLHHIRSGFPLPSMQAICPGQDWGLEACGVRWQHQDFKVGRVSPRAHQSSDASDQELLRLLFRFYVREFRWGREVVSIRSAHRADRDAPEFSALPTGRRAPDVEDPFLLDRNLNCHLGSSAHSRALKEAFEIADRWWSMSFCELRSAITCYMSRELVSSRASSTRKKRGDAQVQDTSVARASRDQDRANQIASPNLMKLSSHLADVEYFSPNEEAPCFQCKRKGVKGRATMWKNTARWFCQRCWMLWHRQCAKMPSSKTLG